MYIDIVDELNSRYKFRVSYSYSTYRKVYKVVEPVIDSVRRKVTFSSKN